MSISHNNTIGKNSVKSHTMPIVLTSKFGDDIILRCLNSHHALSGYNKDIVIFNYYLQPERLCELKWKFYQFVQYQKALTAKKY